MTGELHYPIMVYALYHLSQFTITNFFVFIMLDELLAWLYKSTPSTKHQVTDKEAGSVSLHYFIGTASVHTVKAFRADNLMLVNLFSIS